MQDSTYLCVQVKSDAMPEEPSDDMQEAEKSDGKPEEAKKGKNAVSKKKYRRKPNIAAVNTSMRQFIRGRIKLFNYRWA